MAPSCALVYICVVCVVGGGSIHAHTAMDLGKSGAEVDKFNREQMVKVIFTNRQESENTGIFRSDSAFREVVGGKSVENASGLLANSNQRSAKILQHIDASVSTDNVDRSYVDYYRFNRPELSRTRLRRVDDSFDFGKARYFTNATSVESEEELALAVVGKAKTWVWMNVQEVYGLLKDLINPAEDEDTSEGRHIKKKRKKKKKKRRIKRRLTRKLKRFFKHIWKLFLGLKVVLLAMFLPKILAVSLLLSWKAFTLSVLALAFAKMSHLKHMFKD